MKRRHLLLELGLLALAVALGILFLPRGLFRPIEPSTHVIEPSVVEATITVGGVPVESHVELCGHPLGTKGWFESAFVEGVVLASAGSNRDGHARFDDVQGQSLSIRAALPDGRVVETTFDSPRGSPRRVTMAVPAIVPGPPIELRVVGLETMEGGDRMSLAWDPDDEDETPPLILRATRDATGRAFVARVPPGHASIGWTRPGRFTMKSRTTPLAGDAESVDLEIGRRDRITGKIAAGDPSLLEGARVSLRTGRSGDRFVSHMTTASRGEFAFDSFAPAGPRGFSVTVFREGCFLAYGSVGSNAPAPTTPCRPRLMRAAGANVRVRTEDGRPIVGVEIREADADGNVEWLSSSNCELRRTGTNGSVRIDGLAPGTHTFLVAGPDWVSPTIEGTRARGTKAVLVQGTDASVDLVAVPARVVRGVVRDPSKRPLAGVTLAAYSDNGRGVTSSHVRVDIVESDIDGSFIWRRLPQGVSLEYSALRVGLSTVETTKLADGLSRLDVAMTPRVSGAAAFRGVGVASTLSTTPTVSVLWKDEDGKPLGEVESVAWVPGSTDEFASVDNLGSESDGRFSFQAEHNDVFDVIGLLPTRPEPLVGFARVVAGAGGGPAAPPVEVTLGPPGMSGVHVIVIDGVDGAPNKWFSRNGLTIEGGVTSNLQARNGVIALPTERLKGATLVITAADDEWGFPQAIVPVRVPIDVTKGVTRVRLTAPPSPAVPK